TSIWAWNMRWSPDGSRLRFNDFDRVKQTAKLWELTVEGTNLHLYPLLPGWDNPPMQCCGTWTANGNYFVFQSRKGLLSENVWAIREKVSFLQRASREPVQLTAGPLHYWGPLPSRDGKRLFVFGLQDRGELVRYDLKTRQFTPYLAAISAEMLDFSRDGTWVAYVTNPEGNLWRSALDGSQRLQLTFPPLQVVNPRWSPDAKRIAFSAVEPGKLGRNYIVSADGGSPEAPMSGDDRNEADPNWSPDGNSLVFGGLPWGKEGSTPGELVLRMLDLKTHQLSTLPGSEGLFSPRWSPGGRYVVALSADSERLVVFDFTTQKWADLATVKGGLGSPNWSRDARYIYYVYVDPENVSTIYRVRLNGHKVEHVVTLKNIRTTGWSGPSVDDSPL